MKDLIDIFKILIYPYVYRRDRMKISNSIEHKLQPFDRSPLFWTPKENKDDWKGKKKILSAMNQQAKVLTQNYPISYLHIRNIQYFYADRYYMYGIQDWFTPINESASVQELVLEDNLVGISMLLSNVTKYKNWEKNIFKRWWSIIHRFFYPIMKDGQLTRAWWKKLREFDESTQQWHKEYIPFFILDISAAVKYISTKYPNAKPEECRRILSKITDTYKASHPDIYTSIGENFYKYAEENYVNTKELQKVHYIFSHRQDYISEDIDAEIQYRLSILLQQKTSWISLSNILWIKEKIIKKIVDKFWCNSLETEQVISQIPTYIRSHCKRCRE